MKKATLKQKYDQPSDRSPRVLLGISGSIAAYKAAYLTRLLKKEGYQVRVIMTEDAKAFITPLTLSTLSGEPVYSTFYDKETGEWNNHVKLADWADYLVIAPLTAQTIAKIAGGFCDNLLLAVYLSAVCPVILAPAMDREMLNHPATQKNMQVLRSFGHTIIDPESGELASGISGYGRMAEPETILETLQGTRSDKPLAGKNVIVSAGPTYEPIDPVRFVGNHSSGKMGYALADALANYGAEVTLVSGPVQINYDHPAVKIEKVQTADEMYKAVNKHFSACDVLIMAAAVADYTPAQKADKKIKKDGKSAPGIELKPTRDILKTLGNKKKKGQVVAGFSLETDNALKNAKSKLAAKNLDFIVLNTLEDKGAGFGTDTNKITILNKDGSVKKYPLKSKSNLAYDIADYLVNVMQ